jgi:hypothetical protein
MVRKPGSTASNKFEHNINRQAVLACLFFSVCIRFLQASSVTEVSLCVKVIVAKLRLLDKGAVELVTHCSI